MVSGSLIPLMRRDWREEKKTQDENVGMRGLTPKVFDPQGVLLPGAREHQQVFAFIAFAGPPTNNHAERTLRPLVIFRKVCLGTRSRQGSENIALFSSLAQTAKLQNGSVIDLFQALLSGTASQAHAQVFPNTS